MSDNQACNSVAEIEKAIWDQGEYARLSPRQLGALVELVKMTHTMILSVSRGNLREALIKVAETSHDAWMPEAADNRE